MKKLFALLIVAAFVNVAFAEAETKQVCHDKVNSTGLFVAVGYDNNAYPNYATAI